MQSQSRFLFLFLSPAELGIGFEETGYSYSEIDRVANVCVVIMSALVGTYVSFDVSTSMGNASGI